MSASGENVSWKKSVREKFKESDIFGETLIQTTGNYF